MVSGALQSFLSLVRMRKTDIGSLGRLIDGPSSVPLPKTCPKAPIKEEISLGAFLLEPAIPLFLDPLGWFLSSISWAWRLRHLFCLVETVVTSSKPLLGTTFDGAREDFFVINPWGASGSFFNGGYTFNWHGI